MPREIRDGKSIVRRAINEIGRQGAGCRIAPPVGQLGLQNAGCAGADEYTNALCTMFCDGSANRFVKIVLRQTQKREPVVAAIEIGQMRGKLRGIHPRHLADACRQIHRIERARRKAGATLAQRVQSLIKAATDTAGRSEMGKPEWVQSKASQL